MPDLDDLLRVKLRAAGVDLPGLFGLDLGRAHPAVAARYAAVKQDLIARWHDDRKAYGEAKTGFVLDTLEAADRWAGRTSWHRGSLGRPDSAP